MMQNLDEEELIIFEPEKIAHSIYVFTDVDCGYCRQFHNQIDAYLSLGIKVHYLAYPRAGIGSDSYNKIASAWCNTDPNSSLTLLKQGREIDRLYSLKINFIESRHICLLYRFHNDTIG